MNFCFWIENSLTHQKTMPKNTCIICGSKHQSARNSELCKHIKGDLPIFTEYLKSTDPRRDLMPLTKELMTPYAIRRIMTYMHMRRDDFRSWARENPQKKKRKLEPGLESPKIMEENQMQIQMKKQKTKEIEAETEPLIKGPTPSQLKYEYLLNLPTIRKLN